MNAGTCLALAAVFLTALAHGADYYVSPRGSDDNDGSGPGGNQALRTIQAGVDRLQPGDTLHVLGGAYRETVTFPRSGEAGAPITVRPHNDERVVISGAEPVTGWERHEGDIWKAAMPWTLGPGRNQVFVGGELMIEARFPNEPAEGLEMYVADLSPLWPTWGEFSIPDPENDIGRVTSALLEGHPDDHWKGALYHGVHYQGWSAQTGVIESSTSGEIQVEDRTRQWWFPAPYGATSREYGRGMIIGHMNALDQPGEWHWEDDTLYLMTADGNPPADVEAKARQLAFDLSERAHIHLTGLHVHAASMRLDGSEFCVVDDCHLQYISHYVRHYAIGDVEHDRDTLRSGETGIFIDGRHNAFTNCTVRFSAGAGFYVRGYNHTIHNCLIDEISYVGHYLNAITDAVSDFPAYENLLVGGHVITFNTMRNAGRHFFNVHGNGTSVRSRDGAPMDYMATLFAHNHLYNGMLLTRDAGFLTGYYCSGGTLNDLSSRVAFNVMHDCYDIFAMHGTPHHLGIVYLDAGTCDVSLYSNLLWATPGSLQSGLWYNTMCVNVHEWDNVFHPEFARTVEDLRPADFPHERPFRFGHDFDRPPPVPQWPLLEDRTVDAADMATHSPEVTRTEEGLSGLQDGSWFALDDVDFDAGWTSAVMRYAGDVREMNTDRTARHGARHRHATDPILLRATVTDDREETIRQQWTFIHTVADGTWLRFNEVPLGEGYRRFRVVYGNNQPAPRTLEVRLDAVDGPLVGEVALPQTTDIERGRFIQVYGEATGAVSEAATGTRDVFLVFRSPDEHYVGEFHYFRFEQYRGEIPLQPTEVKFELRRDSPEGEKLGEFYPRYTGGPETYRDLVASLEPAQGRGPLYVVVRSDIEGPLGRVASVSLRRAQDDQTVPELGMAPLTDNGRMVLPQASHRPQSRPADRYGRRPDVPHRPRTLAAAIRLTEPPTLDGRVEEWEALGDPLPLAEDPFTMPTRALPSEAWVGYDAGALYVAARHPVTDAGALDYEGHRWGATDAMEIAFQDAFGEAPGPILNLYGWPDGHMVSTPEAGAPAEAVRRLGEAVEYRAVIGDGEWTCEWRIPFEATGFTPETAPQILFNLGVFKTDRGAWAIWRGTGGATHVVSRAGVMVFPEEAAAGHRVPTEGLAVWLDAADRDSLELDHQGRVAEWRDRSGNERHGRQPEAAHRPVYEPEGLNDRPALRFDEDRRTRLELPDLSEEKLTATVFAVFANPEPGRDHSWRIFTASDGEEFDYLVGISANVPGTQTGGPRQDMWVFRDRWGKMVRVGCFSPNYQTFWKGPIAEILVYDRELTQDEQDRVRAYLKGKWGLE